MRIRSDPVDDRPHHLFEHRPGCGRRHLANWAETGRELLEFSTVAALVVERGMTEFVHYRRADLNRIIHPRVDEDMVVAVSGIEAAEAHPNRIPTAARWRKPHRDIDFLRQRITNPHEIR